MTIQGVDRLLVLGLFGATALLGCAGGATVPPDWVHRMPATKKELCAVGISGPTYYAEDARANSKALAMTELARTLEVKVKADITMHALGDGRGAETSLQEVAGFASEVVLKQAQVREQWVSGGSDPQYGPQGTIYTMVCMPQG